MQNIYLVRHGEKELVPPDPSLTPKGFIEALKTGIFFENFVRVKIISSPLKRALQTAEEISKKIKVNIKTDNLIRERINFGDKAGQKKEEFLIDWEKTTIDRRYVPRAGESSLATGERMRNFLFDLPLKPTNIILVSHGGAISDLLRTLYGDEIIFPLLYDKDKNRPFYVKHCSITHLVRDNKKFKLKMINDTSHL